MTDASPSPSPRACRTAVKIVALVALLVLHFLTRVYDARTMPLAGRHIYPRSYGFSLSLMSGRGLRDVVISDDSAARPIKEFLLLERNSVSAEEFAVYRAEMQFVGRGSTIRHLRTTGDDPHFGSLLGRRFVALLRHFLDGDLHILRAG